MFCAKCGAEIPEKSKFCPECGEKIVLEEKAGKSFAESETVQNAKKEVNDIFEEAKTASDIQNGSAVKEGAAVPRQEVSFMVKWFYWTGRRGRFDYLLVAIATSLASLALGANPLISFLLCYISAVNLVKRLHDADRSGWFALFLMVVEYIVLNLTWLFGLLGLGFAVAGSFMGMLVFFIPMLVVWGIKLWIFFVPGTPGTNSYGPVPK